MNDQLAKAYDLIKEEQRNADNKANIFVVLLTAFLSFFNDMNLSKYSPDQIEGIQFLYLIMVMPLLMLVISLIPIYTDTYGRLNKKKEHIELNIFYWQTISNLTNDEELFKIYIDTYKPQKNLTIDEKHLLSQIRINSEIMERKIYLHKRAFFIIGQMILIFLVTIMTYYTFRNSLLALAILFTIFETFYIVGLFKKPSFMYRFIKKVSNYI